MSPTLFPIYFLLLCFQFFNKYYRYIHHHIKRVLYKENYKKLRRANLSQSAGGAKLRLLNELHLGSFRNVSIFKLPFILSHRQSILRKHCIKYVQISKGTSRIIFWLSRNKCFVVIVLHKFCVVYNSTKHTAPFTAPMEELALCLPCPANKILPSKFMPRGRAFKNMQPLLAFVHFADLDAEGTTYYSLFLNFNDTYNLLKEQKKIYICHIW